MPETTDTDTIVWLDRLADRLLVPHTTVDAALSISDAFREAARECRSFGTSISVVDRLFYWANVAAGHTSSCANWEGDWEPSDDDDNPPPASDAG